MTNKNQVLTDDERLDFDRRFRYENAQWEVFNDIEATIIERAEKRERERLRAWAVANKDGIVNEPWEFVYLDDLLAQLDGEA